MYHKSITAGRIGPLVAAAIATLAGGAFAHPFQAPVRVSESGGTALDPFLSLDAAAEPVIAFARADGVVLARGFQAFRDSIVFGSAGLIYRCPRVARGMLGALHLYYQENDPGEPERGGEIYGVSNPGGQWRIPGNLTRDMLDDTGLVSTSASDGRPRFAWTRDGNTIMADEGSGSGPVSDGMIGGIAADGAQIHVAFLRGGDVFHGRLDGFLVQQRNLTQTRDAAESSPRIAIAGDHTVAVAYVRAGRIFLRHGSLDEERLISGDVAEAAEPSIAFAPDGRLVVAFSAQGRVYVTVGDPSALPAPEAVEVEGALASSPSVDVDGRGVIHLTFVADGEILYANDALPPEAAFEAEPGSGERPLRVRFHNRSQGDIRRWLWEFGDGTTSIEESPEHIYEGEGAFSVTLHAFGPAGREATATVEDAVLIISPTNVMRIPNMAVFPGEETTIIPVIATHPEPMQGLQVAFTYDPRIVVLEEATLLGTVFQNMMPEFFVPRIDTKRSRFTAGLVLDISTAQGRSVPPGVNQHILHFRARIAGSAQQGSETRIELRNHIGEPPINNIFSVSGRSILPVLESSTIRILHVPFPPPRFFIRGDVDADRAMLLTDAIFLLNYLFVSGKPPVCFDAADIDDSGRTDIGDPIFLLQFLFVGGPTPPYPYPGPGLDPTDDLLPSC